MAAGNTARALGRPSTPPPAASRDSPSPRTLQERLGLNSITNSSSMSTTDNPLFSRVDGLVSSTSCTTAPSSEANTRPVMFSTTVVDEEVVTPVRHGGFLSSSANMAPPLAARLNSDSHASWPVGGQQSNWKAHGASAGPATVGVSHHHQQLQPKSSSLDRVVEANRHLDLQQEFTSHEAGTTSQEEYQGRIRVSEDGEVWRSPPPRPPAASRGSSSFAGPAAKDPLQSGLLTRPAPHVNSAGKPIDLTLPMAPPPQRDNSGFSPLPPFARTEPGSKPTGLFKGIPPHGFRKLPNVDRAASRPPQIAESSSGNRGPRDTVNSYRPVSSARRTSHPNAEPRPYDEARCYESPGEQQYRPDERRQHDNCDSVRDPRDSSAQRGCHSPPRRNQPPPPRRDSLPFARRDRDDTRSWAHHRTPPILASPAGKEATSAHVVGEEIYPRQNGAHENKTWVKPQTAASDTSKSSNTVSARISGSMALDKPVPAGPAALAKSSSTDRPAHSIPPPAHGRPVPTGPSAQQSRAIKVERQSPSTSSKDTRGANAEAPTSDRFRRPALPSAPTPAVKREPRSPSSRPSSIALPAPPAADSVRPLFNPLTTSPEERKPVIRRGFTPPPRPAFLPPAPAATTSGQPAEHNTRPIASTSRQPPVPPARKVAPVQAMPRDIMPNRPVFNSTNTVSSRQANTTQASKTPVAPASAASRQAINPQRLARMEAVTPEDMGEADMEIDELESSPDPPVAGPSRERVLPPPQRKQQQQQQQRLPAIIQGLNRSLPSRASLQPAAVSQSAPSSKGKGRAVESVPAIAQDPTKLSNKAQSANVISLDSDEDDEPGVVTREPASRPTVARNFSATSRQTTATNTELASRVSLQSPSLPPQRPPGEERTRVFALPPKVAHVLQLANKRTPTALRNFLDDKYEELELELQSPLRRIDEIPKEDTIRLVYVELELPPHEMAISLPRDCLRSQTPSAEEREEKRRTFAVQQIVQLAKEGREPETTRFTPAYLIVVFKPDQQPSSANSDSNLAKRPAVQGPRAAEVIASNIIPLAVPAASTVQGGDVDMLDTISKQKKGKKRKRLEGEFATDDAVSVSSIDSTASKSKGKDKPSTSKQARKSLESATGAKTATSASLKPLAKAANPSQQKAPTQATNPAPAAAGSSPAPGIVLGRPKLVSVPHTMHGSLSHSGKDSREKPRAFFRSLQFSGGYIAASKSGHLHYWNKGMPAALLSSEDKHTHPSLSVQTAIWSDEHKLAVLGYVSADAAAVAGIQMIKFNSAKPTRNVRRTVIRPQLQDDLTGFSALAWDPNKNHGLRMAGAEQSQRRLRLWSVKPGDGNTSASLNSLINITTRHTSNIRSILWQPESNKIFTAGADKRVCTIDPITYQTVDEWKENGLVNRIYRRDANLVILCLASNRDQFRCVDLRTPRSINAITFGQPTKKGESLGQYAHGDIRDDYFAYPLDDELHIWDLRKPQLLKTVAVLSGVIQPHWEKPSRLTLLEKKHFTTLTF